MAKKMQKISIKYPVFRNDWSHYKRYFICLGPCFPKKREARTSWGLELIKDDPSMCYDDEECDYDKFEEFIKGLKINCEG